MMRRLLVSVLACATALTAAAPATAARPDRLYIFGDSLVDAGNAYLGTHGQTAQPGYGYFAGRYSNGPVWTDLIEQRLTGHYTTAYLAGGGNFAVGGAMAAGNRSLLGFTVPGLPAQLALYEAASHNTVDSKGLYVLNFGNNDVSALVAGIAAAPDAAAAAAFRAGYTAAFVGNYVNAITTLNGQGVTRFLVGGVPNPGNAEGVALEAALRTGLGSLSLTPESSLLQFDYFSFFNRLSSDPAAFGLPADIDLNLAHACVNIALPPSNPNPDCAKFFSFDGIHPTAPIHAAIAREIGSLIGIGSVPEPALWLELITGFGVIGIILRTKAKNAQLA